MNAKLKIAALVTVGLMAGVALKSYLLAKGQTAS
jgi:hypothetical protein